MIESSAGGGKGASARRPGWCPRIPLEVTIGTQCTLREAMHPASLNSSTMNNDITKDQFVAVLEAAGINAALREKLHHEFERRHPAAHEKFLAWLGIPAGDAARIREQSRTTN